MATVTLTQRQEVNGTYPFSQVVNGAGPLVTRTARFSAPHAVLVKGSALALNDVFELLSIPAGAFVLSVAHKVITVEGGTCTYDVGDGTDDNGYVVAATSGNGNTTTDLQSFNATTTPAFGVGKFYTAADTIDMKLISGTALNLVLDLTVTYIMVKSPLQ